MSLNARQKLFVQNLVKGMTQEKAYIAAGYAKKGARKNASALMTNHDILKYRDKLMKPKENEAHLTRAKKREYLYRVVMEGSYADGIRAVAEDNKMTGEYEAEKLQVEDRGLARILDEIRTEGTYIPPRIPRPE